MPHNKRLYDIIMIIIKIIMMMIIIIIIIIIIISFNEYSTAQELLILCRNVKDTPAQRLNASEHHCAIHIIHKYNTQHGMSLCKLNFNNRRSCYIQTKDIN